MATLARMVEVCCVVPTPRLDDLAQQGLRLMNFNVEPECTPSRSALMTGRMPIRSGTDKVVLPGFPDGLAPCEYTLAQLLSDAGYATSLLGKWHLGSSQEKLPNARGFDSWYGIPRTSNEAASFVQPGYMPNLPHQSILTGVRGQLSHEVMPYDLDARAHIDRNLTNMAVAYIKERVKDEKPFFLYVPFTLPHSPPLPHPDFVDPRRSQYQSVLAEIDSNAGRIIDAIDVTGLTNDTIIVWTSDNGPETLQGISTAFGGQSDSGPFRGEFPSGWEGAIRVPCIIRWPGRIRPGRVSNEIVSILDFYRTFATVICAEHLVPRDRAIDSIDQADFLFGEKEISNREWIMWFHAGDMLAIKYSRFKIHFKIYHGAQGAVVLPGQSVYHGLKAELVTPWIFDLENDPKELWDISAMNPWLGRLGAPLVASYEKSIVTYPNIKPGSSFCPWRNASQTGDTSSQTEYWS